MYYASNPGIFGIINLKLLRGILFAHTSVFLNIKNIVFLSK